MDNINTQQVAKNVKKLAKIASRLDSLQPEIASEIDEISENYFGLMKEAQYVGVQGYAIRNRRCFDNCLRQKRAKSDKPYEEIWNDCHQEYLKAMSDEGSDTWNKYASVQDKNTRNIPAELVKTADTLLELSAKVEDTEQSMELVAMANQMLKEANWFTNLINKMSPSLMNMRKVLTQLGNQMQSALSTLESTKSENSAGSRTVAQRLQNELFKTLSAYIQDFTTSKDFRGINPRAAKSVQEIAKQLGNLRGQIGGAKSVSQLNQVITSAQPMVEQLINFTKGIEESVKTDTDGDGEPNDTDKNPADPTNSTTPQEQGQQNQQQEDTPQEQQAEQSLTQMFSQISQALKNMGQQFGERGLNDVVEAAKQSGLGEVIDSAAARKLMNLSPVEPATTSPGPASQGEGQSALSESLPVTQSSSKTRRIRIY